MAAPPLSLEEVLAIVGDLEVGRRADARHIAELERRVAELEAERDHPGGVHAVDSEA